jgi:alkylation response protein AidB-like acyl-CoA dehydrogenase
MRTIGLAEAALDKMVRRLLSRKAFGQTLASQSVWEQRVAEARIDIEMTRLLTLNAADRMDKVGNKVARAEIAMIKAAGPRLAHKLIDDAIQAHGAGGLTTDFGLAAMYARARALRIVDGPDEVHKRTVARIEYLKYETATPAKVRDS